MAEAREWAVTSLLEEYRSLLAEAEESYRLLENIEQKLATVSLTAPLEGRLAEEARRLRDLVAANRLREAARKAEELCREAAAAYTRERLSYNVEPDTCPSQRILKLLDAMLEAAGPLAPIVKALLQRGEDRRLSTLVGAVTGLASSWRTVAQLLTDLYAAAARLEKTVGIDRGAVIGLAAAIIHPENLQDALEQLRETVGTLSEAAQLASEASELIAEQSSGLNECKARERLYCRWLARGLEEAVAAREEAEAIASSRDLEELELHVARMKLHLRRAREASEAVAELAKRLAGLRQGGLAEAVRALNEAYERLHLSPEEEEVLETLSTGTTVEASQLDGKLLEAALSLCRKKVVRCTFSL